jgi:hypothetical protein
MLERVITDSTGPLAYLYDMSRIEGTVFTTPDECIFQIGLVRDADGKVYQPHIHTPLERNITGTCEFLFIVSGRMDIIVLDEQAKAVGTVVLTAQQALLQVRGGHAISTEPGTAFFEIKQGPYPGRDVEKYDVELSDEGQI